MKIAINDKSMEKSETLDKSDVTGVPMNSNDPKVDSGVQRDVQGSEKSGPAPAAGETAGYAGSDVTGGDLTAHQDAGAAMNASLEQRAEEQEYWKQQNAGEIGAQTVDLKPAAAHPESGLPTNADGKESSGGANAMDDDTQKKTVNDAAQERDSAQSSTSAAASVSDETTRAAMENDDRFLRAVAELENFKRQAARREQEARERASRSVIEDLLPVLD
ncbi:MAG TPA: nucleotide exchange factor GrpE, partial [Abditibacteriaceae bacterium]|nr:nucleotide exchange factor GrpE [Abditibacteriaceae bacterium]